MSEFKEKIANLDIFEQIVNINATTFEQWSIDDVKQGNSITLRTTKYILSGSATNVPFAFKHLIWQYIDHDENIRIYSYIDFGHFGNPNSFKFHVVTNRLNDELYTNENVMIEQSSAISSNLIYYLRALYSSDVGLGQALYYCEEYKPNYIFGGHCSCISFVKCSELLERYYGIKDYQFKMNLFSDTFGDASTTDGYTTPSFDDTSDTIGIPDTPSLGVTNVGFMNVYKTSINQLSNLGEELFPDFISPTPQLETESVSEAIVDGFNNMVINLNNLVQSYVNSNLINYVIDCHIIPCNPATTGIEQNIKIGFKHFTSTGQRVTSDYVDIDCGTLNIGEYYTNFIDYVGTRAKLYLPFVGYVDIQNEYFQNGSLNVTYRFNVVDGSFICFVKSTSSKSELSDTVIATYSGNCCVHLPITGTNYSAMASSLITGAVGLASSPSASALLTSAIGTLSAKPTMQSSNSYNATSSYLGIRKPYLIIEREVSNFSAKYTSENGLPLNVTKKLSEISGFTVCDNIHLDGITCSEIEKNEILSLLQSGIIL